MKKTISRFIAIAALAFAAVGCTIVDQGEVGLRKNFNNTIDSTELLAGSVNQTLVGSVLTFPIKDVNAEVNDLPVVAADNSTMKDFDLTVIYNINPSAVSDLWINKNRSFHASQGGDTYLMYAYVQQTARNAAYKVARKYDALTMNDSRAQIEQEIRESITTTFAKENLNGISINQVQVRGMVPSDVVKQSSDALVRAKNEEKQKEVEVRTAGLEAQRIAALNANAGAVKYMQAQANMLIAEGIKSGKVNTVVIPYDFQGIVNVK